mmetsp:Transcript_27595/g.60768  ORF Transcript_27595/g.60768 Transcript_27595/m.60768 type:complete len:341 (-) Transcript_27595:323-1345(-)|eukprot:CAMPEP_0168167420 /NCGR_PEP_ID=MMETSP0139_2-20121125/2538_1 /TAXON_ID=44445 /ORGANISM="Pseudo-nitzschia australis, Strain 10249 10 AB" /LENGTH=340 /DNA_ID=CAMNT_0008084657 /DNA_START=205 /DNA_END=1227 /DNA_ORIENTATION=+
MCAPTIAAVSMKAPIDVVLQPPSLLSRYACATFMTAVFGVWGKIAFYGHSEDGSYDESKAPGVGAEIHSWKVPLTLTAFYLLGLPVLRMFTTKYLTPSVDVKLLLKETMVIYNGGQVLLNGWMVYRFLDAVINRGHPFIGDLYTVNAGATFGVWIHYMDKYLEFFDTIFMVLRGRMDQVSFLHIYHHVSIAWAWWFAMRCYPGGDAYFGALLNSWIHVMMYSYYALSLLKFPCPWKKYITQAQLLQFTSVVVYTGFSFAIVKKEGKAETKHYACFAVQVFEMTSLFYLFSLFYSKAYKKRKAQMQSTLSDSEVPEQYSISSDSSDEAASNASSDESKKEL